MSIRISGYENDKEMRDLWATLLARELTGGGIHPEFPRALARLTPEDAKELVKISEYSRRGRLLGITRGIAMPVHYMFPRRAPALSQEILRAAGLIERDDVGTKLTGLGRALLAAVAPYKKENGGSPSSKDEG